MEKLEKIHTRKIVPVAAIISAGKSKLLNVILDIKILESRADIGTKFVNVIRYNPNIKEPVFYHLKVLKENDGYSFYKDNSYTAKTGEKEIIEENKRLNSDFSNKKDINYDDIFYMLEIKEAKYIEDNFEIMEA